MATVTLRDVNNGWADSVSDVVTRIATAIGRHCDATVNIQHTYPTPRIRVTAPTEQVEAAAALYCDPIGVNWSVT